MLASRPRAVAAAALLAALSPLVAVTAASAGPRSDVGAGVAKPPKDRDVTVRFVGGQGQFGFTGKISPTSKSGGARTLLWRATSKNGDYDVFRRTRAGKAADYQFSKIAKVGWYRVVVPADGGFERGRSRLVHVTKHYPSGRTSTP